MSDQDPAAMLAALQQQLAGMQGQGQPGFSPAMPGAMQPAAPFTGVSVPVKIQTPQGEMRAYLQLPASAGSNPMALMNALQAIQGLGFQIDTFQRRDNGGNWGGGGGGYRGNGNGGYGGGGGYRNGGGYGGNGGGRW